MNVRLYEYINQAIDFVLPPRCVISGEITERQGAVAPDAWKNINFITKPCCVSCGLPFEFEYENDAVCGECIASPPPFSKARSALKYDQGSSELIMRFKHGDQIHATKTFVPWIINAGKEMFPDTDIITPVPLHPSRLFKRKYNQSALIAQEMQKKLKKDYINIEFIPDLLIRSVATPSQGKMNPKARKENVKNAFSLNKKLTDTVKGKNIMLIDDVYTTGATVKECTKTLLHQGKCNKIYVMTLARSVKK